MRTVSMSINKVYEVILDRTRFGVAGIFGAFFSSNSRSSASTSRSKRTKVSPIGDKLRCAKRTMPKSTFLSEEQEVGQPVGRFGLRLKRH